MLSSLIQTLSGGIASGLGDNGEGQYAENLNIINNILSSENFLGTFNAIKDNMTDITKPRAFLNYLVFDREMRLVSAQSGAIQVSGLNDAWDQIQTTVSNNIF